MSDSKFGGQDCVMGCGRQASQGWLKCNQCGGRTQTETKDGIPFIQKRRNRHKMTCRICGRVSLAVTGSKEANTMVCRRIRCQKDAGTYQPLKCEFISCERVFSSTSGLSLHKHAKHEAATK